MSLHKNLMLYKNLIFTNHALERMKKRHLGSEDIYQAVSFPDKVIKLEKNKQKYLKKINSPVGERKIQVVVAPISQNPQQKLVVSVWVRGEDDKPSILMQILASVGRLVVWLFKKIFK